jgi:hypothetical protein
MLPVADGSPVGEGVADEEAVGERDAVPRE